MPEIDHLSYSSVSLYTTCGRAWCYKYIENAPTKASPALVFGSAMHAVIEGQIGGSELDPVADWQRTWAAKVEGITFDTDASESLCNDGIRMLTAPAVLDGIRAVRVMHDQAGDPMIEKMVQLQVPGVPVPVIGYIDLITEDGVPGDIKTSAKSWSQDQAQNEMQPLFYLAALNQAGTPVPDNRFRHYVLVKTKTPQWQVWETRHANAEMFWLFRMIADVWTGIERGVFVPNPGSWKCSPQYCDFWEQCRGRV